MFCGCLVAFLLVFNYGLLSFFPPHPAMVLASGKLTAFALGLEIPLNH